MEKIQQRAERTAESDPERQKVMDYLRNMARPRLVEAARSGAVPIAKLSHEMIDVFGVEAFRSPVMRRFCGLACAAILAEDGFVPDRTGVRVHDSPLFTYGTTYRLVDQPQQSASLVARLIDVLDEAELREAERLIQARLRGLRPARSAKPSS